MPVHCVGVTNKTPQDDSRMTSQIQATLGNCSGSQVFLIYAQGAKSLVLTRETFSNCDLVSWGFWSPHMVQAWRQKNEISNLGKHGVGVRGHKQEGFENVC